MATTRREPLELLMDELEFLDAGGYELKHPFRLFKDSPSCPNFGSKERYIACSECELAEFAPEAVRDELDCCQEIPLNHNGDTPEMLFNWGTPAEQKRYVRAWLLQQIAKSTLKKAAETASPNVKAK
jgi:hypothetical protein